MWFGYGGNSPLAEDLRPMIEELGMELITIHEWDEEIIEKVKDQFPNKILRPANIKWERNTYLNHLRNADIIIVPANYKEQPAKSANRLVQALSLGKPVICSPLDSYKRVNKLDPNGCCLIAKNKKEWKECLEVFKNENLRQDYSSRALNVSREFTPERILNKWVFLFNNLEKVDIIIPTYNNLECLKLCLDSIRKCTTILYNIIVVNNGNDKSVDDYLENQSDIVYVKKERLNFAKAINVGLEVSKSKYVCLLNDDVIVSKGWLKSMVEVYQNDVGAVGCLSNCDKGWLHDEAIEIETEIEIEVDEDEIN